MDHGAESLITKTGVRAATQAAFSAMTDARQPAAIVSVLWHAPNIVGFSHCDLDMSAPADEQILIDGGFQDAPSGTVLQTP